MYSLALRTIAWYSAGVVLEFGGDVERAGVELARRLVERPVERVDHAGEPLDARARGRLRRRRRLCGRTGVTTVIASFTASNTTIERRADQHRVGHADRIGIGRPAAPPSAAPCRSRDSRTGRPPSAAGRRAARCGFRRSARAAPRAAARAGREARPGLPRALRLISARAPLRAPDQVGIEPDHRIAAAHRAALDRLEQEAHRPCRRRASGRPRPAFRDRRPAWSRPPAASPRA